MPRPRDPAPPRTGDEVSADRLSLVPVTLSDACAFVAQKHRHHRPPQGGLFAVGAAIGESVVGVAIVGRPVARGNQDGYTCEVTRLASDGTRNVCSMLYRAAWRAAKALGWRRLITYTLQTEPGTSLRAAGFALIGEVVGRSWNCASRPRVDKHPTQGKLAWEIK